MCVLGTASTRSELHAGSGQLSPAALAVLALAPLAAVGADGGAPAVLAAAPIAVMRADARAPAVLAEAPVSGPYGRSLPGAPCAYSLAAAAAGESAAEASCPCPCEGML